MRSALEKYFPEIELGIASIGTQPRETFHAGNATYFNIVRKSNSHKSGLAKVISNWRHYQYDWSEVNSYSNVIKEFKPDLIVSYGTENPFVLAFGQFETPSLVILQGSIQQISKHYFNALSPIEFSQLLASKDIIRGIGPIHRWLYLRGYIKFEHLFYQYCKNFSGRTEWDKKLVLKFQPEAHYFHCDEVLNPIFYGSFWDPNKSRENIIYTTCSDAIFKGALTIVRALAYLKQQGRSDIKLHLGGVNLSSDIGRFIFNIINKHDLNEQVQALGVLNQAQIIEQINQARIFVLPSHIENSPNSLCEAMLIGAPCIASNAGGTASMIQHAKEGLVYEPKDYRELAMHISTLMDDPELAQNYGHQARITAMERHNPQRVAGEMVKIYKALL